MKRLPFIFACIITFISVNAFSAYAADIKIAVMDTQKVYDQSEKIMKYWAGFAQDIEAKKQELTKKTKAYLDLENELKAAKPENITAKEYREKTDILRNEAREIRRMQEESETELKNKKTEMSRKFLLEILDAAVEYREQKGITLILEKTNTVAYDTAIDVTDEILKLYDSKP